MDVLSLTYLGNIQYFSKLCFSRCVVDIHEHYHKQSYRNRCEIMTAAGVVPLVVNVVKGSNFDKLPVRDVCIDYSKRWQHQHGHSIVSAYSNSPYFDHYWPHIEPFYCRQPKFLLDFNVGLTETILRLLGSGAEMSFSDKYIDLWRAGAMNCGSVEGSGEEGYVFVDYRDTISPKPRLAAHDPAFEAVPYWQVFSDRRAFAPNLSVIDLLFCEGPSALEIIKRSVK